MVLDLLDVTSIDAAGALMVSSALTRLEEQGHRAVLAVGPRAAADARLSAWQSFTSRQEALEWCENLRPAE